MPKKTSAAPRDRALLESLWREPVERYTLPNGLTVLLRHDTAAPVASVQVWVKTGSIHEGAALGAGLSHYLEHLLFKGTARRAGREISATVQAHGGYINAYTTFDRTVYYIEVPSAHTGVAIDLLADLTLHSTLPADEVAKEKDVILREIDMCLDDPDQRLAQALFETAYRTHPYRQPIIGHREVFAATTREELLAYYRARYVPNNLVVVIAGSFDPAATRAAIAGHFGKAPRVRLAPVLVPDEPAQLSRRDQHLSEDVLVSRAGLGWQIPGLTHPDAPALDLLAMILGHGDSSLLWQAIREKARLVHSIDVMAWTPGTSGLFYVSYLADPDKRVAAEQAVLAEIGRIARKGISASALAKAVRQAVTAEINSRKTMSGQASRLGAGEVVVGDVNYARTYFDRLFALTPACLRRVMRTYLVPEKLTVVSSNPAATAAAIAPAAAGTAASLDFEEITLPNGARLLLQPNRQLPNLHLRLAFAGGPMFEPAESRGLTSLLATLLTKDTAGAFRRASGPRHRGRGRQLRGIRGAQQLRTHGRGAARRHRAGLGTDARRRAAAGLQARPARGGARVGPRRPQGRPRRCRDGRPEGDARAILRHPSLRHRERRRRGRLEGHHRGRPAGPAPAPGGERQCRARRGG
jgi:zinc protease